jgi:hypothetical protein
VSTEPGQPAGEPADEETVSDHAGGGEPAAAERDPARVRTPDLTWLAIILTAMFVTFPLVAREKLDHCPNDGSRWNTIFFLLEYGTYAYNTEWELDWNGGAGKASPEDYEEKFRDNLIQVGDKWYCVLQGRFWAIAPFFSVDMVKVGDRYLSSKPPFMPTVVAGVAWVVSRVSGWTFRNDPFPLMRVTVIIVQVLPFLLYIWVAARHIAEESDSSFVRNFCIVSAALATYLTPYLITLNNHVSAACTVMFAMHAGLRIWYNGRREWYWFALAGLFAGFTMNLEVPAVLFGVVLFVILLLKDARKTLAFGLPAALLMVIPALVLNYTVTGSIKPLPLRFNENPGPYFYPGSYWHPNEFYPGPQGGMDALDEPKWFYLFNFLFGHHGFFLLTPLFLISLLGIWRHLSDVIGRRYPRLVLLPKPERPRPGLAVFTLTLFVVVLAAFVKETGNYGGGCQGPRWLFWLIPLWILMLPAGVEWLGRVRWGRLLCYTLLAVSLFSVGWAMPQRDDEPRHEPPWGESWAHRYFLYKGWIDYRGE